MTRLITRLPGVITLLLCFAFPTAHAETTDIEAVDEIVEQEQSEEELLVLEGIIPNRHV